MKTIGLVINGAVVATTIKSQDTVDLVMDDLHHGDSRMVEITSDDTGAVMSIVRAHINAFWVRTYVPKKDEHAEQSNKLIAMMQKLTGGDEDWKK